MLKIVCAWCGKTVKDGVPGAPVSHLICPPCYEREMRILDEKLGSAEHLTPPPTPPPSGEPTPRNFQPPPPEFDWLAFLQRGHGVHGVTVTESGITS